MKEPIAPTSNPCRQGTLLHPCESKLWYNTPRARFKQDAHCCKTSGRIDDCRASDSHGALGVFGRSSRGLRLPSHSLHVFRPPSHFWASPHLQHEGWWALRHWLARRLLEFGPHHFGLHSHAVRVGKSAGAVEYQPRRFGSQPSSLSLKNSRSTSSPKPLIVDSRLAIFD